MDEDFIPSIYREPEEEIEIEVESPENLATETEAQAVMQSAIDNLYHEGGAAKPTPRIGPTEAFAEGAIQPSADAVNRLNEQFGGDQHTGVALEGLNSLAGEAVLRARDAGYGNLDVKQTKDFFDDESKWDDQV